MNTARKAAIAKAQKLGIELIGSDQRSKSVCIVAEYRENGGEHHVRHLSTWREAEAFVDGVMYASDLRERQIQDGVKNADS